MTYELKFFIYCSDLSGVIQHFNYFPRFGHSFFFKFFSLQFGPEFGYKINIKSLMEDQAKYLNINLKNTV